MRAIRYHAYGSTPQIEEIAKPVIMPDEVLLQVRFAALNPLDLKLLSGDWQKYFALELPYVMGSDLAGTVVDVGSTVTSFHNGDIVIGRRAPLCGGAFADYAAVAARNCAVLPGGMRPAEGAGIPTAAGTARAALFDFGQLQAGQSVLIHAGAGGVGSFAVQFAKGVGAHVIATASGDGIELVRALGADEVIDRHTRDFTSVVSDIDLVLDTVGFDTQDRSFGVIRPGGHLVSIVSEPDKERAKACGIRVSRVYYSMKPGELGTLVERITQGSIRVVVDRIVPFSDFATATDRQGSGRARGKVVLDLTHRGEDHGRMLMASGPLLLQKGQV